MPKQKPQPKPTQLDRIEQKLDRLLAAATGPDSLGQKLSQLKAAVLDMPGKTDDNKLVELLRQADKLSACRQALKTEVIKARLQAL